MFTTLLWLQYEHIPSIQQQFIGKKETKMTLKVPLIGQQEDVQWRN